MNDPAKTASLLDHSFRRQAGRITARLAALLGPAHLDLAEESVQEAMLRALQAWPHSGIPDNPDGWLYRVAHNSAIDAIRSRRFLSEKTDAVVAELSRSAVAVEPHGELDERLRDDEVRMIFMCCHPALSREAQVALSLKVVGGFSAKEIARAFFKEEATVAQILVRAKRQVREQSIELTMPAAGELGSRVGTVLDVIYYMFNEGYVAYEGESLIRADVCHEALRLGHLIAGSTASSPKVHALAALMAFQAARFPARVDSQGELVQLESQDRRLWDAQLIALGFHHFDKCIGGDQVSEFHVQAAIAATYARASGEDTIRWDIILAMYDQLMLLNDSAVVTLNRAVVVGRVYGAEAGLAAIEPLVDDSKLRTYYLLHSARGHFLEELGRLEEAAQCFREALTQSCTEPERRFLQRRLAACG